MFSTGVVLFAADKDRANSVCDACVRACVCQVLSAN